MKALLLVMALAVPSVTYGLDEWSTRDTVLEIAFATTVAMDWKQTAWALENGYYETNPLLGRYPSRTRLGLSCLAVVAGHVGVAKLLPRNLRTAFQIISISIESSVVYSNFTIGAKLAF
jgi:hypothetical protein